MSRIHDGFDSPRPKVPDQRLDRAIERHGHPKTITVDHGTEFTSRAM